MKKVIKSWIVLLSTVGPMVAAEFFAAPWLPFAARAGYFVQVALIWALLLSGLLGLCATSPSAKTIEAWERHWKRPAWQRASGYLTMAIATVVFAAMGWYWLAAGEMLAALLGAALADKHKPQEVAA